MEFELNFKGTQIGVEGEEYYQVKLEMEHIRGMLRVHRGEKFSYRPLLYTNGASFGCYMYWDVYRGSLDPARKLRFVLMQEDIHFAAEYDVQQLLLWEQESLAVPQPSDLIPDMMKFCMKDIDSYAEREQDNSKALWGLVSYAKFLEGQLRVRTDPKYRWALIEHDMHMMFYTRSDDGLYMFYFPEPGADDNWVWDENKMTGLEAEERYPQEEYMWVPLPSTDQEDSDDKVENKG